MSVADKHFRRAVLAMLALSVPAIFLVSCLFGFSTAFLFLKMFFVQIAAGYICMGAFAWLVAPSWGAACTDHLLLAGLFGVLVFMLGIVSGSLSSIFVVSNFSFLGCVLTPVFWLGYLGGVPAFIIGFVGGCLSRLLFPHPVTG